MVSPSFAQLGNRIRELTMNDDEREERGKEPREQMVNEVIVKKCEETIQVLIEEVALFVSLATMLNARVEMGALFSKAGKVEQSKNGRQMTSFS